MASVRLLFGVLGSRISSFPLLLGIIFIDIQTFVRQDVFRRQGQEIPGTHPGVEQDVKYQLHSGFFDPAGEPLIFFLCPYLHFIGPARIDEGYREGTYE